MQWLGQYTTGDVVEHPVFGSHSQGVPYFGNSHDRVRQNACTSGAAKMPALATDPSADEGSLRCLHSDPPSRLKAAFQVTVLIPSQNWPEACV